MTRESRNLLLFGLFVFCTRIPFLFDGYGSEEDAWALQLVSERIGTTGIYEVSRLPGHPVQEIIYSTCWELGPVFYNVITAFLSTLGMVAFVAMLKNLGLKNAIWCGVALAFTPVVYINSSNAMDYTWAMSFIMFSGYFISRNQLYLAAGMLAFAVGCRITSGAMLLPYAFLIWNLTEHPLKASNMVRFTFATLLGSLLVMSPVIYQYGTTFFTYYEHFEIPGILKNAYKGSIGVWGLAGCLALLIVFLKILYDRKGYQEIRFKEKEIGKTLVCISGLTLLLYYIAFSKVPLKSAFLIPACPFVILALAVLTNTKTLQIVSFTFLLSCFFFGINLAEKYRGSMVSSSAITLRIAENDVAIDPLQGLVLAEQSKRKQQLAFVEKIIQQTSSITTKTILIAGWWNAALQVISKTNPNEQLHIRHYVDEPELKRLKESGYAIFYLEDQGVYNDLRFRKTMTEKYAQRLVY